MNTVVTLKLDQELITISYPEKVVSTNVANIKNSALSELDSIQRIDDFTEMLFDFSKTEMVDSLGLNLLIDIIFWCEERNLVVKAKVTSQALMETFKSVWLHKKMDILS